MPLVCPAGRATQPKRAVAQRLDALAQQGVISTTQAEEDPDRFCLTSVLLGEAVSEIDSLKKKEKRGWLV
jgi:hypothetical protein